MEYTIDTPQIHPFGEMSMTNIDDISAGLGKVVLNPGKTLRNSIKVIEFHSVLPGFTIVEILFFFLRIDPGSFKKIYCLTDR